MTADDKRLDILRKAIRDIPDFPKKGILFRDITPLLGDPKALRTTLDLLEERYRDEQLDRIVAVESRGFIFGCALADRLGIGFAPVRKPGKLPWKTVSVSYDLEYGSDTVEMHSDALEKGERVLLVDDLLATGGTAAATCELVERIGGKVVGAAFVVELLALKGREKIPNVPVFSLVD